MRVNLRVPFAEKDQAKALGARWDPLKKVWYLTDPPNLDPFRRWLDVEPRCNCPSHPNEDCPYFNALLEAILRDDYGIHNPVKLI